MISRRAILAAGAALTAAPALTPVGARATPAAEPIRVPIGFARLGMPMVQVTIAGQGPLRFGIDTGAESSAIRQDLVGPLKLHFLEGVDYSGLGGDGIAGVYMAQDVVFGGVLRQRQVVMEALNHVGPGDGLLAAGFLTAFPSELDYGAAEIRIYPKGQPDFSGYMPIPSDAEQDSSQSSPRLFCRLTIDGIALKVLIDTGAPSELTLFSPTVKANGLWDKFPTFRTETDGGVTGAQVAARVVTMPDLHIGDIHAGSLQVTLLDPGHYQPPVGHDGMLGSRFLSNFSMAITRSGTIALRPNADSVAPPKP